MARGKGLTGKLFESGTRFVARAAESVMKDARGQDAVARAVGLAQRGRRRVEQIQERLMKTAGIPGRQDYDDLAKQLARIKRKARDLAAKLGEEGDGEDAPAEDPERGAPRGDGEPR